jgi:hypothetical protein
MDAISEYVVQDWRTLVTPLVIFFLVLGAGWFIRRIVFRMLERWATRSETNLDDHVVQALRGPFMVWMLILGLHLATQASSLPPRPTVVIGKILLVLWIISATTVASRLAALFVRHYGRGLSTALPVTTLTQTSRVWRLWRSAF